MPFGFSLKNRFLVLSFLVVEVLSLGNVGVHASRGLPPTEGILNFGKIDEHIYRGAQPDAAGIKTLQRIGIKTVIDLRMPGEVRKQEAVEAKASGILYTNFPLRGFSPPSDDQIQKLLGMIDTLPGPVFIHCKHGCDRTGTLSACYRIRNARWASAKALKEARYYGLSILEQGMWRYVRNFDKTTSLASLTK